MSFDESDRLEKIIQGCLRKKRKSQKQLYELYYRFGFATCRRYARNKEEAEEMVNNGFLKLFLNIDKYDPNLKFESWARRIFINVAIDYYRKYANDFTGDHLDLDKTTGMLPEVKPEVLEKLSNGVILKCVAQLPPSYRIAFNLYVVDGYSHPEIAEMLQISVGSSKSNLSKARAKLKTILAELYA